MLRSILVTAVAFAIVGPFVGILGLAMLGYKDGADDAGGAMLGLLWLLPFGYLLGALPAALAGALAGLVGARASKLLFVLASAIIGSAAAALTGWLGGEGPVIGDGIANLALLGGAAGLFAGLAALPFRRAAARQPILRSPE